VTVAETQQQGYEFSSGSCVVTTTSNVSTTIPLAGTSGDVAGITPGSTVRCNLINKQVAGTASWSKTADDGHSLKGSVWTLTYPDGSKKDITGDDQGHFSVANLPWGAFKLVEKEAPAGYQVNSTEHAFTIDATHLSVTVADSQSGSVVNNKQHVPDLPMTGGASTDLFMISGAVVLILAAALGSWHIVSTRKRMRESSELKQ
jgi:LPXTG-motif cell wall-anchored protein